MKKFPYVSKHVYTPNVNWSVLYSLKRWQHWHIFIIFVQLFRQQFTLGMYDSEKENMLSDV